MRRFASIGLCAALPLLGCAAADKAATQVQAAAQASSSPTLSTADAAFFDQAARAGIEEVTFGQLARTQAARAAVRDFALRMVDTHTTINQDLTRLAARKQIAPPLDMDPAHQQQYTVLQALTPRSFDRAYLDGQASDHRAMLALFHAEAAHGADPQVRAFAARLAPQLAQDLHLAERLGGHPLPPA
jgi:putative membrane protein